MKAPNNKFADYKELNTVPNVPQYLFSASTQYIGRNIMFS